MIMSYSNNTITSDVHNYLDIFQNIHETSVMIHEVNEAFELLHHASIVNHWFLLSGILIICIAIVCPMITEIRKLDAK